MVYRINIVVEEGAKLLLDERFDKKMPKESLVLGGIDIELKEGSSMKWIKEQSCESESFAMLGSHSVRVSKGADCKIGTFDFGEGRIVHNLKVELDEDSRSDLSHLLYGDGSGQRGNITLVEHKGNTATTKQNARHILKDSARGIFDAIIRVDHEGKYAKTDQNTRSILLNDGAYMISKPQLEIYIDDLEASHGSTTGEIDPAQLFYLRSRGIGKKEAKRILIYAFAKDLIESVGDEQIQNRLIDEFEKIYKKGEE
jgi:Fe-S cluster assembly protein SufD